MLKRINLLLILTATFFLASCASPYDLVTVKIKVKESGKPYANREIELYASDFQANSLDLDNVKDYLNRELAKNLTGESKEEIEAKYFSCVKFTDAKGEAECTVFRSYGMAKVNSYTLEIDTNEWYIDVFETDSIEVDTWNYN